MMMPMKWKHQTQSNHDGNQDKVPATGQMMSSISITTTTKASFYFVTNTDHANRFGIIASTQVAGIGDIAVIDPEDRLEDEEDSEAEDDIIKPTDNLVIVGHVDDDAASLEVFSEYKFRLL